MSDTEQLLREIGDVIQKLIDDADFIRWEFADKFDLDHEDVSFIYKLLWDLSDQQAKLLIRLEGHERAARQEVLASILKRRPDLADFRASV